MIITKLERIKGQRLRVYLNDEAAFCLKEEDLLDYPLRQGEELTEAMQQSIYDTLLGKRAKLKCMETLERSDHTEMELRRTLKKAEYPAEVIEEAIAYVTQYRYLNDQRYAQHFIERNAGRKSRQEMKAALLRRGVSGEDMESALEQCTSEDEEELVRYWMRKKRFDPETASREERGKFMAAMARRGIPFTVVQRLVDQG